MKWTGVRFSDFAQSVGAQNFAFYGRFVASDGYVIDEDMKTLMHPQVMLAWLMNDKPIPPAKYSHGLDGALPFGTSFRQPKVCQKGRFFKTGILKYRKKMISA